MSILSFHKQKVAQVPMRWEPVDVVLGLFCLVSIILHGVPLLKFSYSF
ncbi:hypothetical protein ACJIZ3_014572 [Penstemon smallii]|uniref:Uncharacterized protein n=1 Tax=Penstemon smallii TaxID=265156 RepID=A0ABD3RK21_9LAMI